MTDRFQIYPVACSPIYMYIYRVMKKKTGLHVTKIITQNKLVDFQVKEMDNRTKIIKKKNG